MTTRQLYYLVTISDTGSLSKAAQILGISQPALSKFLTEYEDSLGSLLFLRYHRQLTPTFVGRYVIQCAQKILEEQTRLMQTLRAATDQSHTRIRLATAPNRGAIIYSRIYNQFSNRYPDISLTLSELYASDQPGAITHGQIDLAIGSGSDSHKVTDLPFAYEELLVSLPVAHPLSKADKIRLTDLRDTPFVLQGPRHSIRILAEELFREAGFYPVVTFESSDVILVDSMLHQAAGVGLVSQAHVFPCDELVYLPLDPPVHQTLHIRYPLGHTLTEPEQYLAGLLIRERLSDSRYQAIPSSEVQKLLRLVEQDHTPGSPVPSDLPARTLKPRGMAPEINLNTQLLPYIIAIVDEKSLSRAAEKFYLPQPALSRHLRNAESMLCASLFTRVHNRLQPTNAGKIFVNFARNILKIEEAMNHYIHSYQKGRGGGIYLYCDSMAAPILKGEAASAFAGLHPEVTLHIQEKTRGEIEESPLNASSDLGVYFSCQNRHPILNCRILAQSRLVYCFGSGSWKKDLSNPRIMAAPPGSALRDEQDRLFEKLALAPECIVCEAQLDILRTLSDSGAADTILPCDCLSHRAARQSIDFEHVQDYYLLLVSHPSRRLPDSAGDLIRILEESFTDYFHLA